MTMAERRPLMVVNTDFLPGYEIVEMLGLVKGNTVRSKHIGKDILASLKQITGGEITGYTEMLTEARDQALGRMAAEAYGLGADAVINVRFATSAIMEKAAEVMAYGTAVRVRREEATGSSL